MQRDVSKTMSHKKKKTHKLTTNNQKNNQNTTLKEPQRITSMVALDVLHLCRTNGGGVHMSVPTGPLSLNPSMRLVEDFSSVCSLHSLLSSKSNQHRDPALTLR